MAFEIHWSTLAKTDLEKIYEYQISLSSIRSANRLIDRIISRVNVLENHPRIGQREEQLRCYLEEFRYLVTGHYKIIYWIDDAIITISSVFDCRQDPEKLKELFK